MQKAFILLVAALLSFLTKAQNTVGTVYHSTAASDGYTLFEYMGDTSIFLIDNCGRVINRWESDYSAGTSVYLQPDGSILRAGKTPSSFFPVGGQGGVLEKINWDGNLEWQFFYSDSLGSLHHDFEVLPNGNILAIAFELISEADAIAAGRDTNLLTQGKLWPEKIIEIQPAGTDSAHIVWEWRMWDHIIQDFDSSKANYGVVSEHPELFNLNYALNGIADWAHANSIDYNPTLDQIVVSLNFFDEFFIIDHSTTTLEAASNTGGISGKGGNILFRYGNPAVYDRGDSTNQVNYRQHDVHWVPNGLNDSGKLLFYNNGNGRPEGNYSSVDIIDPPIDLSGQYILDNDSIFIPDSAEWSYTAPVPTEFYSPMISGAQRLENGNTLICQGRDGRLFEIDGTNDSIVWEYWSPINNLGTMTQGDVPFGNRNVFRAVRYPESFPGFTGKDLTPMDPIELNPDLSDCLTVGVTEPEDQEPVRYYPNPVVDRLYIQSNTHPENVSIYSIDGILVRQFPFQSSYNLKELPTGVYILLVGDARIRIVKE